MNTADIFKTEPAVFAVGKEYNIMIPVKQDVLMWVQIGKKEFYDAWNGIMCSNTAIHRIVVPMEALDKEKKYTVCYRKVIERKPYFSETDEIYKEQFEFRPVKKGNVRTFHISDAHNMVEEPVKAAHNYIKDNGKLDFLILNGDIPDDSGRVGNFDTIYKIIADITHGNIPVVYAKGNHDNRGLYAEDIAKYTPASNGNSYYSFRLGNIWGLVLDCGEDKSDLHEEYGNTVCCEDFRKKETQYIENIIHNAKNEYKAKGVEHRIIISHIPFTRKHEPPFDIEEKLYSYWAKLIRKKIKPNVMICGHEHKAKVIMPGGEDDILGHPCPLIIGSIPRKYNVEKESFVGMGMEITKDRINVKFISSDYEENNSESTDILIE